MYSQYDADVNQYLVMDTITDHNKDQTAVDKADTFVIVNGQAQHKKTTKG